MLGQIKAKNLLFVLSLFWALAWCPQRAFAQAIDGNIVGNVVDATAAVVPNATVEAENVATGVKIQATTDANGLYRFNNIPVGTYNVTAKKAGFSDAQLKNLAVELNKTTTANVVMQVGAVTTTVEVVEATSAIDTTTVQLQNTYQNEQIVDLPIIEHSGTAFGALNLASVHGRVWTLVRRPVQHCRQERHQRNPRIGLRVLPEPQLECARPILCQARFHFSAPL
jgi:hypothetical protein